MTTFKALWVDKKANESVYSLSLIDREVDALPAGMFWFRCSIPL